MTLSFLVVDDNTVERESTAELLLRAMPGAELLQANGGESAIALLEDRRLMPSLIFTDLMMPGGNGFELMAALRQLRWLERTPVAVASELISDKDVMKAYRLGACAVLTKPMRLHEIREVIRDHAQPAKLMASGTLQAGNPFPLKQSAA